MKYRFRKHLSAPGLLKLVRSCFDDIQDCLSARDFSLSDCLMSALAVFGLKYPSLLQFDRGREDEVVRANLKSLYGVEQAPQKLHRHVLEGQGWAVELLHQPEIGAELNQRDDSPVTEAGVGVPNQLGQTFFDQGAGDEGAHDLLCQRTVVEAAKSSDLLRRQARPLLRDVEPAVPRQACQEDFVEAQDRGRPPC